MIPRTLFSEEHVLFRDAVRKFADKDVRPDLQAWEEREDTGTDIWKKCGEAGFLCATVDDAYGGAGADKLYSMILLEELGPLGGIGLSLAMHSDIVARYIHSYGSEYLKTKYLPKMVSGEMIGALAMSEPSAGSDVKTVKTRAERKGDHWVLNGSKIFISAITVVSSSLLPRPTNRSVQRGSASLSWTVTCRALKRAKSSKRSACGRRIQRSCSSMM